MKTRLCPLWPETANLLKCLLKQRKEINPLSDVSVFVNHKGEPFTRYGIRYLINKYVQTATVNCSSLERKRIHPHTIRHSTAMALLQAGVDINTIRAWLGHTQIETTNRYAEINLEMKRKILNSYLPVAKFKRPWKQNQNLLQWLESI
jgi:site-specific recombinase XerD